MSRSDFPPGYDESRLLSNPDPGRDFPPSAPPYDSYGGPPPYSLPNNTYPGQPGGFPPPVIAPIPIPVIPTDSGDNESFATADEWDSTRVRHIFIRKVYLILAAQLVITVGIVAVFTFVESVSVFVRKNPAVYWTSYVVYLFTHSMLVCCQGPRRRFPCNLILLTIFTLSLSYMTGTIASFYSTKAVFLALGITVVVCIAVTVFCFQTKVDFTKWAGFFSILAIVLFVTSFITLIVLSFKYVPWLHMLYAGIGAIAFTLFLAYETQLLIGNGKYSISPEEYVFAALTLYIDIIHIFLFLLQIIGFAKR